jgi:hypothetical protein
VDNNYLDLGMNKNGFVHTLPSGRLNRMSPGKIRPFLKIYIYSILFELCKENYAPEKLKQAILLIES